jgi:hypothetical protein
VVRKAVAKKDYEAAARAAASVQDPLLRAAAAQRIALSYYEAGDVVRARELLQDASKLVESADDDVRKGVALLQLAALYLKVDDTRVLPTTQASVNVINNLPSPKPDAKPGTEAHRQHVETLMQLAYVLIPAFQRLSQEDEGGTFALAERIRRPELRAAAVLGAAMGLPAAGNANKAASAKAN